jgi:hypothetical protein
MVLGGAVLALPACALLASIIPARRATSINRCRPWAPNGRANIAFKRFLSPLRTLVPARNAAVPQRA